MKANKSEMQKGSVKKLTVIAKENTGVITREMNALPKQESTKDD